MLKVQKEQIVLWELLLYVHVLETHFDTVT